MKENQPNLFLESLPCLLPTGVLAYLLGGERGRAAVSPIIVAVGPVVDGITPSICLERLVEDMKGQCL